MSKLKNIFDNYTWIGEVANKVIVEIKKTTEILEEMHNVFFSEFNISSTKFNLMVILYNAPVEGLPLSEIGDQMLVTKANITGLVDRLEKQGYVERIRHSSDRRKIMASITENGRSFTEDVIKKYKIWSKDVLTILDDDDKILLLKLFKKFQTGLINKKISIERSNIHEF
ncbi:MarR family winged helix-turn-helix transcriptional regulator [Abyssisolibacter fermentans]|uniref:MarR family winged helix-turn-helix transcriptional regulator n=1 Tax=Abyssisolibacter fermentans TaxID=1766203 RepID=UPI00082F47C7|nr:MarR family transcriptional regulator [Abyssisolibacter fermentans]